MHGRIVVGLALVVLAGCVQQMGDLAPPAEPGPAAWSSTTVWSERACTACHLGPTDYWQPAWDPSTSGWNLSVSPRWPQAPFLVVHGGTSADPVLLDSWNETIPDWRPGQTASFTFDVPDGAAALVVSADLRDGPLACADDVSYCQSRDKIALTLQGPDLRVEAMGPEPGLPVAVVEGPAAGVWRAEVLLEEAERPLGTGHVQAEVLGGALLRPGAALGFNGTTFPEGAWARVWVHHDHALFQTRDFDESDVGTATVRFASGNATPPDLGRLDEPRQVLDASHLRPQAYADAEGRDHDLGYGSDGFWYYTEWTEPVPAGTARIRFEHTWDPPVELDDLMLKVSHPGEPFYRVPAAIGRGAGFATYAVEVDGTQWEPAGGSTRWEVVEFVEEDVGSPKASAVQTRLRVFLEPG